MSRIFSAELFKIMKGKALRVNLLINIGFALFYAFVVVFAINSDMDMMGMENMFPGDGVAAIGSSFIIFWQIIVICAAVLAGIWVCDEFDNGTIRNVLSKGVSRTKFYVSKLVSVYVVSLVFTVISVIILFATITIAFTVGSTETLDVTNLLLFFAGQFLIYLTYVSLFVMMAFLFRNVGATLGVGIAFPVLIELLFVSLLSMSFAEPVSFLANIFPQYNIAQFNDVFNAGIGGEIVTYGREYVYELGAYIPVVEETASALNTYLVAAAVSFATVVITTVVGIYTFNKRDVK